MVDCFLEAKTKKRNTTKPTSVAGGTAISFASKMSWICNRRLRINWSNRTNTTVNGEPLVAPSRSGPEQLNKVGRLGDQLPPVATRASHLRNEERVEIEPNINQLGWRQSD